MTDTDRKKIKDQQAGEFVTTAGIVDAAGEVTKIHSRLLNWARSGSENAATNIAEAPGGCIKRLSKIKSITVVPLESVSNDTTNYDKIYVYKYNSTGGSKTLIGSWNTHTSAQSAMTAFAKHTLSLVSSACASVAADSPITYHVGKSGSGQALTMFSVTVDGEEI